MSCGVHYRFQFLSVFIVFFCWIGGATLSTVSDKNFDISAFCHIFHFFRTIE